MDIELIEKLKEDFNRERVANIVKSKYFIGVFLIALVGLYLRITNSFFTGMWVDEARYATIGEEVAKHLLTYSGHPEWSGKITGNPPIFPYLIAVSNYLFSSTDTAARIISPAISTLGIVFSYFLGREMRNKTVGLMLAALMALNPIYWFLSTRILIGATLTTIYTLAVLLFFYGLEDRRYSEYAFWAFGPALAISLITKQPAYTLGLIVPIYFIYRKRDEFRELLFTDTEFSESKLKTTLMETKYYISAGLGLLVLLPWMVRNMGTCGFPMCGLQRALRFATTGSPIDVEGTFFFLANLPTVITTPLAAVLGMAVIGYVYKRRENPDYLVKYFVVTSAAIAAVSFVKSEFIPMIGISSIAALATKREEKLLWLWIGVGIGFMSIPAVKVPRYIIFTVPALLGIASFTIYELSEWASENLEMEIGAQEIALAALLPFLALSFLQGSGMVTGHSFQMVEPAGEWLDENTPEDARIAASSARQITYYAYPRYAEIPQVPRENFTDFLKEENMSYVEVDIYERVQPEWMMTDIAPYKLPNSVIRQLQRGQVSAEEVASSFQNPPDYLTPVAIFGETRMPLTKDRKQPKAMIYKVNKTALP